MEPLFLLHLRRVNYTLNRAPDVQAHKNPVEQELFSLFLKWRIGDSERLIHLPKNTQLRNTGSSKDLLKPFHKI